MNVSERLPKSKLWVDPGFVHHRLIEGMLGPAGSSVLSQEIAKIPASTPDWRKAVLIDHIYSQILLDFVGVNGLKSLEEVLATQSGHIFCSIVTLKPTQ